MTTWRSRGHRGDVLEDLINQTNEFYQKQKLGRVDKINTPIKVVDIDSQGIIKKGFFEKKSTVDFLGIIQGIGVAFDAKETANKSLPLINIHDHQIEYMRDIHEQGGLAFIICHFSFCDEYFLIPYEMIQDHYDLAKKGGRKSIPYTAMVKSLEIKMKRNGILDYLATLNAYLTYREGKGDHQ